MTTLGIYLASTPTEAAPHRTPVRATAQGVDVICRLFIQPKRERPAWQGMNKEQLTARWETMPLWMVLKELWQIKSSGVESSIADEAYLSSGHTFQKHEQELKAA